MKSEGYVSCMGPSGTTSMYATHWVSLPLDCQDVRKMEYHELREVKRMEYHELREVKRAEG